MDRRLAEALISPLREGQLLSRAWQLKTIEVDADSGSIRYILGRPDLAIRLHLRPPGNRCYSRTRNFDLIVEQRPDLELSKTEQALVRHISDLVQGNDTTHIAPPTEWQPAEIRPDAAEPRSRSTFYLVPGHLGDARDMGLRSLHILRRVGTVFVEAGTSDAAAAMLEAWGIDPTAKRFHEVDTDDQGIAAANAELERVIALGEDACLFGGEEGLPGFHDPCDSLRAVLRRHEHTIDIRTVGGGSALSAATLRVLPSNRDQAFFFLGHLEEHNTRRILARLEVGSALGADGEGRPSLVFYSSGPAFKAAWHAFREAAKSFRGTLHLCANLNCPGEYERRVDMRDLDQLPVETLRDHDKLVVWLHP